MVDFNTIRLHFEAFIRSHVPGDMEEFDNVICEVDLVEPLVQDNWFTWTSKVLRSGMLRGLDCILVNGDWLVAWPRSRVSVLCWGISDHSPILFYPSFQLRRRLVSFCFFNHWVEDPSFIDMVSSV